MITTRNLSKVDSNFYHAAYGLCLNKRESGQPMNQIIDEVVALLGSMVTTSADDLRCFLQEELSVAIEPVVFSQSETLRQESNWWDDFRTRHIPKYWIRYEEYLRSKPSWSLHAIEDIDDATNKAMNALANPTVSTPCDRMGMVFGYVQSGKTAHYMGLINKAIDSGYKIIIVLSGIHNSLRSQTQARIDEEVLGYETSQEYFEKLESNMETIIGVGNIQRLSSFQSLTNRDSKGDINKKVIGVSMNPPFVIITKKIASVLRNLIQYFKQCPFSITEDRKKKIPAQFPVLIIDDEADQASINTQGCYDENLQPLGEYNPSTINGLIRKLLSMFTIKSYIGYTATPFANIFIPPAIDSPEYGTDLFPRDFIMRIPRADLYMGAREFFGFDDGDYGIHKPAMPLYRQIIAGANYMGKGTKSDDPVGEIPSDLKKAIQCFFLSVAIRNCRGQRNKPNSMLIHIIRYKAQQNKVKQKVTEYRDELFAQLRYQDPTIIQEMMNLYLEDYRTTTQAMNADFSKYMKVDDVFSWEDILVELQRLTRQKEIKVLSVNGDSRDSLVYKDHENKTFNAIIIGGDKLSRGLTLEGLSVSYFTRTSTMYDTLMQMGRWFGYRLGYADLCRLFTTDKLYRDYYQISAATEDLVRQFDYMNDVDLTPNDFGLRVLSYPNLLISSKNKVHTGEYIYNDFSAKLTQTRLLDRTASVIEQNEIAVQTLVSALLDFTPYEPGIKNYLWRDVSHHYVTTFLDNYITAKRANRANSFYMKQYIHDQVNAGQLSSWNICLVNVGKQKQPFAGIPQLGEGVFRSLLDSNCDEYSADIHALISEKDEYYDYTVDEERKLESLKSKGKRNKEILRKDTRKNGLLLLYPFANSSEISQNTTNSKVFGFAIVFPDRKGHGHLQPYHINEIARKQGECFELDS